jgi:hypothetical protein
MTAPLRSYANHLAMHDAIDGAEVLGRGGMGSYELLILLVLARHAGKDQPICWLSYETIARESLCSRDTAIRSIKRLQDGGHLRITGRRRGGTNQYLLVAISY